MREIELYTSDGGFVAVAEIVPFPDAGMPTVILWGERVFVVARGAVADDLARTYGPRGDGRWRYVEAFAVVSFTPSPGLPR